MRKRPQGHWQRERERGRGKNRARTLLKREGRRETQKRKKVQIFYMRMMEEGSEKEKLQESVGGKKIKVMCDRRKAQGRTRKGIGPC